MKNIVGSHNRLFVRQEREVLEILTDIETRNKYSINSPQGERLAFIYEEGSGIWGGLKRLFLRSHRGFVIRVVDAGRNILLTLKRSFFFLFSHLYVLDGGGLPIGSVKRRFGVLYKKYDLYDNTGARFARVRGPRWRLWTFPVVYNERGLAVITKKWGGALREMFSDADTFLVEFTEDSLTPEQRIIVFAASISIDFDFFEENRWGKGGLLGMWDR